MELQLIRNATLRLNYNWRLILIDPYLGAKFAYDPIVGKSRNPTVELPCTPEEAIDLNYSKTLGQRKAEIERLSLAQSKTGGAWWAPPVVRLERRAPATAA